MGTFPPLAGTVGMMVGDCRPGSPCCNGAAVGASMMSEQQEVHPSRQSSSKCIHDVRAAVSLIPLATSEQQNRFCSL